MGSNLVLSIVIFRVKYNFVLFQFSSIQFKYLSICPMTNWWLVYFINMKTNLHVNKFSNKIYHLDGYNTNLEINNKIAKDTH